MCHSLSISSCLHIGALVWRGGLELGFWNVNQGDLTLKDGDSSVMWSTQTYGKSVVGMNLTDTGNLVLFDKNNAAVWQSFDHPTDTLLLGQKLRFFHLFCIKFPNTSNDSNYVEFTLGHLELFVNFVRNDSLKSGHVSTATVQYLKFESDGHLRVYEQYTNEFFMARDPLTDSIGHCGYPMVCGSYGVCEDYLGCSCLELHFKPIDHANPSLGCTDIPLSCEASQFQIFFGVAGLSYFDFKTDPQKVLDLGNSDVESCKNACANKCSCQAALFKFLGNGCNYSRSCYLLSQVFSFTHDSDNTTSEAADSPNTVEPPISPKNRKGTNAVLIVIITSSLGSLLAFIFLVVVIKGLYIRKCVEDVEEEKGVDEVEEDYLDQVPGAPKRFTYDDLKTITKDFNKKLGEGGFNSVYQGTIPDGKKNESFVLDWQQRRKIIFDIARGLCYLYEECRWKIVHMGIKPQNILLDEKFNAKITDFGLSKIVDRD
ncbi:hypothetical protein EUGRSUZ_K01414 [Eucalyptus grandis]|uniref:non-specific serine/threonine protein kinase n=2 Tax=Eucalyptus grandis TaxID=71139 RepID=A0A059A1Q9_EUCGR|nr:hypothetical protein EUGRSUZ_K01414 [Eucalyptus grandis]